MLKYFHSKSANGPNGVDGPNAKETAMMEKLVQDHEFVTAPEIAKRRRVTVQAKVLRKNHVIR